ncbi:hypothetical protein P153DRAFT_385549 [Dothidotthia symphoricarpi CBS 119687]|uniref:Uncharacterized protein n=1 Tax=Dothidotthia symphoricarpi CBS 119687 TaxID=1392245 RepID=A0A6A6AEC3_9PLEO|nr:uncharacterized protein P153DRAFT_385549 [Dothidotthia symphoricarpi CBS 119687]KAF2129338.1 hypothetical protein P153DRAFT_385549 [Dothidotthia symphoricarpi CBS 119687]
MSSFISNRPSSTFNWADDESDDFDLTTWKATADTSAPTAESLGPLLPIPSLDETENLHTIPPTAAAAAARAAPPSRPAPCVVVNQLPAAPQALLSPDSSRWLCASPKAAWAFLAENERCGAPAYPELSFYENGVPIPWKRKNYAANWRDAKVRCGRDCRRMAMVRGSGLRWVVGCYEDEEVGDWEDWEDWEEDVLELQCDDGEEDEEELLLMPEYSPSVNPADGGVVEVSLLSFDLETRESDGVFKGDLDAGVIELDGATLAGAVTDTDAEVSVESDVEASATGTSLVRNDSMEVLTAEDKQSKPVDSTVDTTTYTPEADIVAPMTTSPDLEYTTPHPGFTTYLSNTLATAYFCLSSLPWKTAGIVAAGAVTGAVIYAARRR